MKILTFTSLYPNSVQPRHGIFIENRMQELHKTHPVDVTVVAPVPWFPFKASVFGRYATLSKVPKQEDRNGITVLHPRYLVLPKIGMSVAPLLMFASLYLFMRRLQKEHRFDVLDGHFFYPDGVVAALLGRSLNLPVMNTARGSDVALYPQYALPRSQIRWAVKNSSAAITVCEFLKKELHALAPDANNLFVMRNGVDLELFKERDRFSTRKQFGVEKFTILSVGNLIELKGHHLIIEAMQSLPDCELLIAGDGEMKNELSRLISERGLKDRVRLVGLIPHDQLAELYSAADCLVLASRSEGWANVLLESMACGTPVVATRVAGTPEVVQDPTVGLLIDERTPAAIRRGIDELRVSYPERAAVRSYAAGFSWEETSDKLFDLATKLVNAKA